MVRQFLQFILAFVAVQLAPLICRAELRRAARPDLPLRERLAALRRAKLADVEQRKVRLLHGWPRRELVPDVPAAPEPELAPRLAPTSN